MDDLSNLCEEHIESMEAIARVRRLHEAQSRDGLLMCKHCGVRSPCDTILALEDELRWLA